MLSLTSNQGYCSGALLRENTNWTFVYTEDIYLHSKNTLEIVIVLPMLATSAAATPSVSKAQQAPW